jgi:hypothetical protein
MDKINGLGDVVKSVTNFGITFEMKKEEFYLINYFLYKGCRDDNTR